MRIVIVFWYFFPIGMDLKCAIVALESIIRKIPTVWSGGLYAYVNKLL